MPQLSANPAGIELEDFVAAHLAARGAFVERGVTERDPQDLLELDVVWTDYRSPDAPRHPIEVKSGAWGLGDLFKFYGWTRYLELPAGAFVCLQPPGRVDSEAVRRLTNRLGVRFVHIEDLTDCDHAFEALGLPAAPAPHLPSLWRFSFWAQRRLIKTLSLCVDRQVCRLTGMAAKGYFKLINDAVFFEPDVRQRVDLLLDAHLTHPRLALAAAAEMEGRLGDINNPPQSEAFTRALFRGHHAPVQACLFLAHRARLAILKAAVDQILLRRAGPLPAQVIRIFGREIEVHDEGAYAAFNHCVERYADAPNVHLYPVLWQSFMWAWGGFLLLDRLEDELAGLSQESGVPVNEVRQALTMFDTLFPLGNGVAWFNQPTGSSRSVLKLMPAPMRGIGAYGRLLRYRLEDYGPFGRNDYTSRHLASDHNAGTRLLDCTFEELLI